MIHRVNGLKSKFLYIFIAAMLVLEGLVKFGL